MNTLFSNLHFSEATYETGCPHNLILAEAELTVRMVALAPRPLVERHRESYYREVPLRVQHGVLTSRDTCDRGQRGGGADSADSGPAFGIKPRIGRTPRGTLCRLCQALSAAGRAESQLSERA